MDQNPYAAPQTQAATPGTGGFDGDDGPQPWEIGEVLSLAWERCIANWGLLVGSLLLSAIIVYAFEFAFILGAGPLFGLGMAQFARFENGITPGFVGFEITLMAGMLALQMFLQVGMIRIYLAVARGEPSNIGVLFSGAGRLLPMIATFVLLMLAVGFGSLLLIIPGIIASLGLMFSLCYAADSDTGVFDALAQSWNATSGQKLSLFVLMLVLCLLNFGGMLLCGLGLLVTVPLSYLVIAIVFSRVSGRLHGSSSDGSLPGVTPAL